MPHYSRPTDTGARWLTAASAPRLIIPRAIDVVTRARFRARQRSRLGGLACAMVIAATPSVSAAQLGAAASPPGASSTLSGDTTQIRRVLRKEIEEYQDYWRKAWQKVEFKRHNHINLMNIRGWPVRSDGQIVGPTFDGLRTSNDLTTELRRYLSILCYVDTPSDAQIEAVKARTSRLIGTVRPNPIDSDPDAPQRNRVATPLGTGQIRSGGTTGTNAYTIERQIRPVPNYGAQCPQWVPPDEKWPLDEGEAIDLAIPPAEREVLRRRRDTLIRSLESARAKYPGDEWISGQLLRFVIDQRSPGRAVAAANACEGSFVWCTSLAGLAHDEAGNAVLSELAYRSADSARAATLIASDTMCTDPELLLLFEPRRRSDLQKLSCTDRAAFYDRMWWLTDPLWSVAGNERFVAHKSRQTHASLRAVLDRDERYIWARLGGGEAMRELVVRFGWPSYTYWPGGQFEEEMNKLREDPARPRFVFPPYTAKEYTSDRTALIPQFSAIGDPFSVNAASYNLNVPKGGNADLWWPQEHMMLWTKLEPMHEGQSGMWRRDSTVFFSLAVDRALRDLDTAGRGPSTAVLIGSTNPNDMRLFARENLESNNTLRLNARLTSAPIVLSAEIQARTRREIAQRNRFGIRPPQTLREMKPDEAAMSDPVIMLIPTGTVVAPNNADAAMLFMAGGTEFTKDQSLALFWESYGILPTDSVAFELRINRTEEIGAARRLGSALGLASDLRDSVSIRWTEPNAQANASVIAAAKPIVGHSVAIDVKSLPAGNYMVSLVMRSGRGAIVKGERRFVIRE